MTIWESLEAYGNKTKQCVLVGKVKACLEAGYSEQEIAKQFNISEEFTRELKKMIEFVDDLKKAEK